MDTAEPTLIYLDSCDYSALSKPQLSKLEAQQLASLRALKLSGKAIFVFSGAHISEMSPLAPQYATTAAERTGLMVELCGRNTLVSFDKLMKAELSRLVTRSPLPVDVFDKNGEWFPDMGSLINPIDELDAAEKLRQEMEKHILNRKARRMLKATTTYKNGRLRSDVEKRFGQADYSDLIDKIPMRPRDFRVLKNYVLGRASREDANKAFLESLRDPNYMVQWFIHNHQKLGAIVEWVRRPAQQLLASCEASISKLQKLLASLPECERTSAIKGVSGKSWKKLKQQGVLDIINHLLSQTFPGAPACDNAKDIEDYCPGIHVCINAFYNSLQNSFLEHSRVIKASDFVDIIHAIYTPYVSYFRADRYMCGVVQPLIPKRFGTKVVASPAKLILALGI